MPAPRRRKPARNYEDDPVKFYLRTVGAAPALSATEESRIVRRILSGERAKVQLMESNLKLVVSIARQHANPTAHLLDLIQAGNNGLMRAVSTCNMAGGRRFAPHARKLIREAIQQHLEEVSVPGAPNSAEPSNPSP